VMSEVYMSDEQELQSSRNVPRLTADDLYKLSQLRQEIVWLERRLAELSACSDISAVRYDAVSVDHSDISNQPEQMTAAKLALEQQLERSRLASYQEELKIERFVAACPDVKMRNLLRLRFVEGLEWHEVVDRAGMFTTPDAARMAVRRYINQPEPNIVRNVL